MGNLGMYKDKARFVKKLQTFYIRDCGNAEDIKRLDYVFDAEEGTEFVYVSYQSYSQRRFNVRYNSYQEIAAEFFDFLEDTHQKKYFWLMPSDPSFRKEFLEDE